MHYCVLLLMLVLPLNLFSESAIVSTMTSQAQHRGVYELVLDAPFGGRNSYFDVDVDVLFIRPDETQVSVDAFFDGDTTFKARAYCDQIGTWSWVSISNVDGLNQQRGQFEVMESELPGKLRKHPQDSRQLAYDNGDWFLHIGDTGYRYVTATEPLWQPYIDQAAQVGFNKIRTWFCQDRYDVQILFGPNRESMNLEYWQEIDRRMVYALEQYPHIIFQLLPYGEDTQEIIRYGEGDRASIFVGEYAQARFSALPNVYWSFTNDRHIISRQPMGGRDASPFVINKMGDDFAAREPWGTLLTNHQQRFQGYYFLDSEWSDLVTLEDRDQVDGRLILLYRQLSDDPVIMDEDRYELYLSPEFPRYFFRRLMWASLFSGGSATYGGLRTYEAYDSDTTGVQGYYDAAAAGILEGAADFNHIHAFFKDTGITLVNMIPQDELAEYDPYQFKCIRDNKHILVYLQNAASRDPQAANVRDTNAVVKLHLPRGLFGIRWFNPRTGEWTVREDLPRISGGYERELTCPFPGDAVLVLTKEK